MIELSTYGHKIYQIPFFKTASYLLVAGVFVCIGLFFTMYSNTLFAAEKPAQLFDIRISTNKKVYTDTTVFVAKTEFVSFGRIPTPVTLQYTIEDTAGKVVYTTSPEVFVVETELYYPRRFPNLVLEPGEYVLKLHTSYNETINDTFSYAFKVREEKEDYFPFIFLGLITTSAGVWIIFILRHWLHKKPHTRRHLNIVSKGVTTVVTAFVLLPSTAMLLQCVANEKIESTASVFEALMLERAYVRESLQDLVTSYQETFSRVQKQALYTESLQVLVHNMSALPVVVAYMRDADGTCLSRMIPSLSDEVYQCGGTETWHTGIYRANDTQPHLMKTIPMSGNRLLTVDISLSAFEARMHYGTHTTSALQLILESDTVHIGVENKEVYTYIHEVIGDDTTSYKELVTPNGISVIYEHIALPEMFGEKYIKLVTYTDYTR